MNCESCDHANVDGARFCASCGALMPTPDQGEDPLIGQVIGGRYRITRVLGEGGMGIVYEGEQQMGSTVRKVAVKTLHAHLSKDPSVLARFHRECGTVAQLEHPNTIKFYDFGATPDGTLYIAMEFVKGAPLNEPIEREGAMPPDRVLKILKQVCGALDEAHGQGVIHRDLKPENIILTKRAGEADFVKVLDFGIAARSEGADQEKEQKLTQQGMVLGTPPYMSPEQFTGKSLDSRSDIYSLGVLAYEMLTGRLPFDADTPWQWATQHMTAQPLPFDTAPNAAAIPETLRAAIMRALSKEREERQATTTQFYEEISGGGGLTIDEPALAAAAASDASTGTAQMAAAPDFSAPAASAPLASGAGAGPQHSAAPITPHAAPPIGAPPPAARPSGGGKGLIIGLGVVGAVLLAGIIVLVARSMKPTEDDGPLTNPFTDAGAGTTEIKPVDSAAQTADPIDPDDGTVEGTGGKSGTSTTGGKTSTGGSKGTGGTVTPPKGTGGGKSGTGGSTGTKPNAAACAACIAAARSGNIQAAASNFRQCSDAGEKAKCSRFANGPAIRAVTNAERNNNCPQAKAIAAAAASMGASGGNNALKKCR